MSLVTSRDNRLQSHENVLIAAKMLCSKRGQMKTYVNAAGNIGTQTDMFDAKIHCSHAGSNEDLGERLRRRLASGLAGRPR